MNRFIINADDFGLTEGVNRGIVRAFDAGALTSTSLMANGRAFEHAVRLARSRPTLRVGIHLTLLEESPVLPAEDVSSLVDDTGHFYKWYPEFVWRYLSGRTRNDEIHKELAAQFEAVTGAGLTIDHIDSHCHLHVLPSILEIVIDLTRKYGVEYVRVPLEPVGVRGHVSRKRFLSHVLLNAFCFFARRRLKRERIQTSDFFLGFSCSGDLTLEKLKQFLQNDSAGTIEIMCHPGDEDEETIAAYGHWGYHWRRELEALLEVRDS